MVLYTKEMLRGRHCLDKDISTVVAHEAVMNDASSILTPSEFVALREATPKKHQFSLDVMLNTGARYTELQAFSENPGWFDSKNRLIALPAKATKTGRGRDIHLTSQFSKELDLFLMNGTLHFPLRFWMNHNLKTWWYAQQDANGEIWMSERWYPTVKTFRKTWETYLLCTHQDKSLDIWASQGHTGTVSMNHYYQSVGRLKSELDAVRECTRGWGT